jgi:hypothetical protein
MSSIAGVNVATRLDFDALTAPSESDAAAAVALIDKTAATLRSSVNTGDDADGDDDAAVQRWHRCPSHRQWRRQLSTPLWRAARNTWPS